MIKMKVKIIFALSLFGLCTVFGHPLIEDQNEISTTTVVPVSTNIEKDELANAVNSLGYKIMTHMMSESSDKNVVISPTGIAGLLAMTLLGTVGESYDELAEVLGFSQDMGINRENHAQFGNLLKTLNSNETSSKTMYADAIFVDGRSQLRAAFQEYLSHVYDGEARGVDFSDKENVKTKINEWVSEHTSGKIADFLKEPLPQSTKAVLLSALYFSGQWKCPFIPEYTKEMPFKKTNGEVMVDMMLNLGDFDQIYSVEDDVHMIAIPYNDSTTTLYALKPRKPQQMTLTELMDKLNYSKIVDLIGQMKSKKSIIRFPKMDLKSRASLEGPLQTLGVQSIFIPGKANFALMIDNNNVLNKTETENLTIKTDLDNIRSIVDSLPNPGIYVDSIIHDVRIKIDEYGTEAVAATSGILARTAMNFHADSPFYMFIRNEKTKLVTFSAVIFDPTS